MRPSLLALQGSALAIACALAGCAPPVSAPATPLNSASGGPTPLLNGISGHETGRRSVAIATPAVTGTPLIDYGNGGARQATPETGAPESTTTGTVSLNFADTDIRAVVAQILGKILGVSYTIDPSVHGKATLHTAHPVQVSKLLPILQTLLAQNHAELIASKGVYRVVPLGSGAGSPNLAAGRALGGSAVVPLHYVSATHLAHVLQPYVGKGAKVVAAPNGNALLIEGSGEARQTLRALIHAFDVNALAGQSYALLPARGGTAQSMAATLSAALTPKKGDSRLQVLPLARIQAVMVIAPSSGELSQAERVYRIISTQAMRTRRIWHVYYLRNSNAADVAHTLQEAFTPNAVTAQPSTQAAGQTAPGLTSASFTSQGSDTGNGMGMTGGSGIMGNSSLINSSNGTGATGAMTTDASAGTTAAKESGASSGTSAAAPSNSAGSSNPLLGPLSGSGTGSGAPSGTRIIADAEQNAVLVYATADRNAAIHTMLRALDTEPMEVEIDATVAEVTLNSALQYGTQFFFKSGGINAVLSQGQTSNLAKNFPGFVLSGHNLDGAPLAISALQSVTQVKVLSSPQLLVQNNRTANLVVGNLVPYLSQTSQSTLTSGAPVINSINYQETGVILRITPQISNDGLVRLQISQQVSAVAPTVTTRGLNSPTFSERAVSSSVVVHNGQTVGLAGLITDTDQKGNSGIPFLKDVPLLGSLFSTQNNQRQRTELLILLTPHVVRDETDAISLTDDLRAALPAAASVPSQLAAEPFDGSDDPNERLRKRLNLH